MATEHGNWGDDDNLGRKHVFTTRPDSGGATPTRIEGSGTPLAASITDVGVYSEAAPGNGGNDENLGEKNVFTATSDAGGAAQQRIEGYDTLPAE